MRWYIRPTNQKQQLLAMCFRKHSEGLFEAFGLDGHLQINCTYSFHQVTLILWFQCCQLPSEKSRYWLKSLKVAKGLICVIGQMHVIVMDTVGLYDSRIMLLICLELQILSGLVVEGVHWPGHTKDSLLGTQ